MQKNVLSVSNKAIFPTAVRSRTSGGRVLGTDGSVWLYRVVPMAPVADAVSPSVGLHAAEPTMALADELADMTPVKLSRRSTDKVNYRQIHLLLINIPGRFSPPPGHPLAAQLAASFSDTLVDRRVLLVGVRLRDRVGGAGGFKAAVSSVAQTITTGTTPLEDFDIDYQAIDAVMARSGMTMPTKEQFRLADSWWNHGVSPDAPILVHADHIHVFGSVSSARSAARLGPEIECERWPELPSHHTICFGCVADYDLPFVAAESSAAHWATSLLDDGAVMVSIRAKIEPPKVTRAELRRRRKQYMDDIRERDEQGKMSRSEQDEMFAELQAVEAIYATGGPPTLVDCSAIVAFAGRNERTGYDLAEVARGSGLSIYNMATRQEAALAETWMCSAVRSNPYLHDLPSQTVAASGLPSLSVVGDRDGALIGFTERDRQPAWLSPTAAANEDSLPLMLVVGATGSGKSVVMTYLADQFARMTTPRGERTPVVILDPKQGSDFSAAIEGSGGRVASLDNLIASDGVYDPMRFSITKESGIELAASMLMAVNPWGTSAMDFETPLIKALAYGSERGADCIGVALQTALDDGQAPEHMVQRVFDLTSGSPMFRACVGMEQGGARLRASEGITYIRVGGAHLDLPDPGSRDRPTQQQRIALALVRMMVFGSAMALTGRSGVLMADEAWVLLSAGRAEVERLGRLARSQQVFPMLFTQRVTDALNADLTGYISRGLILPISDPAEAQAACELFKLEATPQRMNRITATGTIGATTAEQSGAPNWGSMRALRDPESRMVLRGTIGIYADLSGRAVPVEIKIPQDFLDRASTNPEDIRRREIERAMVGEAVVQTVAQPDPVTAPSVRQHHVETVQMPANPSWD